VDVNGWLGYQIP